MGGSGAMNSAAAPIMGGFPAAFGGAYPPMTGFGNLGMDSAYLNPVLEQRIEFLRRQIARYTKKPTSTEPLEGDQPTPAHAGTVPPR